MEIATLFWSYFLSEKSEIIYDLFYELGLNICSHNSKNKVNLRDACEECILSLLNKSKELKISLKMICSRKYQTKNNKNWTIAFIPFTKNTMYVDFFKFGKDMNQFIMKIIENNDVLIKTPNLFGNCVEYENYRYNQELHFLGYNTGLYSLLIIRFILLEYNKSKNKDLQLKRIKQALEKSGLYEQYPVLQKLYVLFEDKIYEDWKLVTFSCNVLSVYINK
jgi:hypothetical protein